MGTFLTAGMGYFKIVSFGHNQHTQWESSHHSTVELGLAIFNKVKSHEVVSEP